MKVNLAVRPALLVGVFGTVLAVSASCSGLGGSPTAFTAQQMSAERQAYEHSLQASPSASPTADPISTSAGNAASYTFEFTDHGTPARWNPCQPIHFRLNLGTVAPGDVADLAEAMRRIAQVTGLSFTEDGTTNDVPQDHATSAASPVVIAFSDPAHSRLLTENVAADTAPTREGTAFVSGVMVFTIPQVLARPAGFHGSNSRGALFLRQLAHLVGLGQVNDPGQLMDTQMRSASASFAAGDLAGLRLLGAHAGCFPAPSKSGTA